MEDHIKKFKEISLTDSEYNEEMIRYAIDYEVVLLNGVPASVNFTKIVRTEFQDEVDLIQEVEELPYFMQKNLEMEEIEGWVE